MKTNKITNWAALVCGLLLTLPLTLSAQNLVVNGTVHPPESGKTYTTLQVAGSSAAGVNGSYNGTDITFNSTAGYTTAARVYTYGTLSLTDSRVTTSGNGSHGVSVTGYSKATLNNVSISTTGYGAYALVVDHSDLIAATNIIISTTGANSYGVSIDRGTAVFDGLQVSVSGSMVDGAPLRAVNGSYVDLGTGARLEATGAGPLTPVNGQGASALRVTFSVIEGVGATITSALGSAAHIEGHGTLTLTDSHLQGRHGIAVCYQGGGSPTGFNTVTFSGGTIDADENAIFVQPHSGGRTDGENANITISGATITSGTLVNNSETWDTGTLTVNLNNSDLTNAGGIVVGAGNAASSVTNVNVTGGSGVFGDVSNSGSGALNVSFNNSSLTGSGTVNDNGTLTVNIDDNSTWNMTGNSIVTSLALSGGGKVIFKKDAGFKTLTTTNLSGSGEFEMNTDIAAGEADRLIVSGTSAGAHQVRITNHGAQTLGTEPALLVIETADGQATFNGSVSVGMFDYTLYQDQTDWYLSVSGTNLPPNPPGPDPDPDPQPPTPPVPPVPHRPDPGTGGKVVLITPPSQPEDWFNHGDNIGDHMNDLRSTHHNGFTLGDDKTGILDSVWIKAYGAQLNVSSRVVGSGYREYQYGTDIGADHNWQPDKNNTFITGAFVGYGKIDRQLRVNDANDGGTDNYRAGLYAIWLHECGLWADLVVKGQYSDHDSNGWDSSGNLTSSKYDNWGFGATFDLGKQFKFKDGWYVEPSLSAGYVHFTGENYTTGGQNQFDVSISDINAFQFKLETQFGRVINLSHSGLLQPYIKVGGIEQISTGGKVTASGYTWRPTLDGARAVVGAGLVWQLDADNQLHLDYEASFGDKYDKPWGLNFGYRHQF